MKKLYSIFLNNIEVHNAYRGKKKELIYIAERLWREKGYGIDFADKFEVKFIGFTL